MHVAQNWRLRGIRYALQAVRCDTCGTILLPTQATCPTCDVTEATANNRYVFGAAANQDLATVGAEGLYHNADNAFYELRQAAR